ncbi:carbamoyltransferase HypF [Fictibacillus sp. UD]|uniref:carbamoyltransferase HypF n=1 Tax=Fictibacillus sp. UD TaxID=3038777 RepID=UPI0037470D37
MLQALSIKISGRIQGVGFRPFVYSLAKKYELKGTVKNNKSSVIIHVEGHSKNISNMVKDLRLSPPRLSKIIEMQIEQTVSKGYKEFSIEPSQPDGHAVPLVSSDAAICTQCLEEMFDPLNRRYEHPFINCTQCGPRYSIITNQPYDRPNTTMKNFIMCSDCQKEYEDPSNRRHHAQPICCPECGPDLYLLSHTGELLERNKKALEIAAEKLKQGKIVAVKGVGGYHLACDAFQERAIAHIRHKKNRPERPLAVMAKSIETVKRFSYVSKVEEQLLTSAEMPIVVLKRIKDTPMPANISPGLSTLGIMLPYSPLHHLLFKETELDCLVMTSANLSGMPIHYKDDDLDQIHEMCEFILTHNRKIHLPIDDSVVRLDGQHFQFLRRARGYTPELFPTSRNIEGIIALGANQKNTFAIGTNKTVIMSPHIGELDNEEMNRFYEEKLTHFKDWFQIEEKYIAIDKHPAFATAALASRSNKEIIRVQHHHAHHVSCMEENHIDQPCIGIILDGTGFGDDGHIWGFECLYGNANVVERLGHLSYTPLPGGEKAIKEPWRNAAAMILYHWPHEGKNLAYQLFPDKLKQINLIESMINNRLNVPLAGTCGRLFDAVSAILGICMYSTYEGEAAIKLADYMEDIDDAFNSGTYPFNLKKAESLVEIDYTRALYQIIQEKLQNEPHEKIITKFHNTIIRCCVEMVLRSVNDRPELNKSVVLSGGSFQNIYLLREMKRLLLEKGFKVYTHKNIPCHDGGISFGQLVIAAAKINQRST